MLGLWAVVTWGLWTTLQGADEKAAGITNAYETRLDELRKKWDVPANIIVVYSMECYEIFKEIADLKLETDNSKIMSICGELDPLRGEYYTALEPAYIVRIKVPYLQDPIAINALTLADWWPFGLMAVVASAIILSMRERINAVIVAWISYNRKNDLVTQDLIIHSDFLVGTLTEDLASGSPCMLYRKPPMIQPESLLVYALIAATIYLSFSFGLLVNPASSYEMESTLTDYVALIWYSLVGLGTLVWFTRKRYAESLESFMGVPVRGRFSQRVHRAASNLRSKAEWVMGHFRFLGRATSMAEGLFAIAALMCLYLPWMNPQHVRGYRFFLSVVPGPLDEDLYLGLRVQLFFVTLFIILCLTNWLVTMVLSRPKSTVLEKIRRFFGLSAAMLLGNLVFHVLMLQLLADEQGWLLPWNRFARPHPVKNSSMIWTEPSYGFWLFLILCLMLVVLEKKPRKDFANLEP